MPPVPLPECQQEALEPDPLDVTPSKGYLTLSAYCHCSAFHMVCKERLQVTRHRKRSRTTHWKQDAIRWLSPAAHLAFYEQVKDLKYKFRCAGACGVQVGSWHTVKKEWSIWPETLERDEIGHIKSVDRFRPTAHQFYGEWRIINVDDGLPQYIGYEANSLRVG